MVESKFGWTVGSYYKYIYNRHLLVLLGVNNHHQTTIFGFALLANKTIETFEWVLTTFMDAMADKKPISVVTDADQAMERAIKSVFPEARHRQCVWHLSRNAKANIQDVSFVEHFNTCMLSWWTPDEFEQACMQLVDRYELHDNAWINEKYKTRSMWAQAYLTGHFFGYLRSTSGCEGMNSYLQKFIDTKGTLLQFVRTIDSGLSNLRYSELEADYNSRHTKPELYHALANIESQAAAVYTRESFLRFQKEFRDETLCFSKGNTISDGSTRIYTLFRYKSPGSETRVIYNVIDQTIKCSCLKFETDGIPCSHAIHIMKHEHMSRIPKSCILHRWTIDAKDCASIATNPNVDQEVLQRMRYGSLQSWCNRLCLVASRQGESYRVARVKIAQLTARMEAMCKVNPSGDEGSSSVSMTL